MSVFIFNESASVTHAYLWDKLVQTALSRGGKESNGLTRWPCFSSFSKSKLAMNYGGGNAKKAHFKCLDPLKEDSDTMHASKYPLQFPEPLKSNRFDMKPICSCQFIIWRWTVERHRRRSEIFMTRIWPRDFSIQMVREDVRVWNKPWGDLLKCHQI